MSTNQNVELLDVLGVRYDLVMDRVCDICSEDVVRGEFGRYFSDLAGYLRFLGETRKELGERLASASEGDDGDGVMLSVLREHNRRLYADILPENYDASWANPRYACARLGDEMGKLLCVLSAEIYELPGMVYESVAPLPAGEMNARTDDYVSAQQLSALEGLTATIELFVEIYNLFTEAVEDALAEGRLSAAMPAGGAAISAGEAAMPAGGAAISTGETAMPAGEAGKSAGEAAMPAGRATTSAEKAAAPAADECPLLPPASAVRDALYWFFSDYCDVFAAQRVLDAIDPDRDFATRIVMESDLSDLRYLYRYGEYVTDNELETARFLAGRSEEEIDAMARTFTEGYRTGFVKAGKDLSRKKTVNIRYQLGFERMVRRAVEQFAEMGLRPVIYRRALSRICKSGTDLVGYSGAPANLQLDFDHKEDQALFLDGAFVQRKLDVTRTTFEANKMLANTHAGPAVIEVFGEPPFSPKECPQGWRLDRKGQELSVRLRQDIAQITNQYIIGEERSFTIIAFPSPQIGPAFPEIFSQTMRINQMDSHRYEEIQQYLIDALDTAKTVHVTGRCGNRTDLTIALAPLEDPAKQTNFENCVADVNIPVGEVFTSPQLEGTNGVLHVTQVYLNGLDYHDLSLTFTDGMISAYSCGGFDSAEEGRAYIKNTVLFNHETLPMGEFAIGTNTAAYAMAQRYGIGAQLPILIAEKCGPHFAVGDTCYSWEEDVPVYNPDGKEITARDNSVSRLRKEDPRKAYFNCHTDITIPYSELGMIEICRADGERIPLLKDGRFVLAGTEELNKELD